MMVYRYYSDRRRDGLLWGLLLIAIGSALMLDWLGVLPHMFWVGKWGWIVVGIGVLRLVTAYSPRGIGSGVSLTIFGLWFVAVTTHWHGLEWNNSWPVALVAAGAGMVARAIASFLWVGKREDGHVEIH